VNPKSGALGCADCHDFTGETTGGRMPFAELGYHTWPAKVKECTLCHGAKSMSWKDMHNKHAEEMGKNCIGCHTTEPTGWIEPPTKDGLCNNCHSGKTYSNPQDLHKKHAEAEHGGMRTTCTDCHTFDGAAGGGDPVGDTVAVTKSEWDHDKHKLDLKATNDLDDQASLSATYGGHLYAMTYKADKDWWELKLEPVDYFDSVEVCSDKGGCVTHQVTRR